LLEVKALIAVQGHKGADEALRLLDEAAARHPHDVPIARERVELVIAFQKWQAAERAIEGYKRTLYETQGQMAEAHAINARLHARMGRLTAALGEYRIALAQQGWNVSLWLEYGLAAEHAGRDSAARDAYREAARLSPNNPEIARAMDRIEGRERKLRALLPPAGGER
jgi:tetratricopeptide (TPR) repeat protein